MYSDNSGLESASSTVSMDQGLPSSTQITSPTVVGPALISTARVTWGDAGSSEGADDGVSCPRVAHTRGTRGVAAIRDS
jgi:hypothetical protein